MKKQKDKFIKTAIKGALIGLGTKLINDAINDVMNVTKSKLCFSIQVQENSNMYKSIINWLYYNVDSMKNKIVPYSNNDYMELSSGIYTFKYKDNLIIIKCYTNNKNNNNTDLLLSLSIYGKNHTKLAKEIMFYTVYNFKEKNSRVHIKLVDDNGNISSVSKRIETKNLNEIFIDNIDEILSKINKFKSNKQFYEDHKIPYKYGILLYGEQGTGKTTLIKAIAKYLGYSIIYVTPDQITNESISNFIEKASNSIILFEDVDKYIDTDGKLANIANIMNMTDGVISPANVIFAATTNHIEKLDKALFSNRRFDDIVEIKPIEKIETAEAMCKLFGVNPEEILNNMTFPIVQQKLQAKILESLK